MLNPELIKDLKDKIENDKILNVEYVKSSDEDLIFSSYKLIIEAEVKIDEYLSIISAHKEVVSKNVLHNNKRVRSIFADYLEILKRLENKVISSKENISKSRKNIIEDFSLFFETSQKAEY